MHILIIPSWYKTSSNPRSGTFFEVQARMFQKRGHKVSILYPRHNLRFLGDTRSKEDIIYQNHNDAGIPTFYSFTESLVPKFEYPTILDIKICVAKSLNQYKVLKKQFGKPDVIHAHSVIWGGVVANEISIKENIPFFLTEHFTGWLTNKKYIEKKVYRELFLKVNNNAEKSFAVSSFFKEKLINMYGLLESNISVLPNIVNDIFLICKKKININSFPFRVVIVGNLIDRKNHLFLFRAIELLKNQYPIKLTVIGEGPEETSLKSYVLKRKLCEIEFLGALDRKQIVDVIRESHTVFSASILETFGVNLIEGLAMGKPVIALDSGGPRDIINSMNGILIKENTPEAFADAIKKMINTYGEYDQDKISDDCKERFGEEIIYSILINQYNNCNAQ